MAPDTHQPPVSEPRRRDRTVLNHPCPSLGIVNVIRPQRGGYVLHRGVSDRGPGRHARRPRCDAGRQFDAGLVRVSSRNCPEPGTPAPVNSLPPLGRVCGGSSLRSGPSRISLSRWAPNQSDCRAINTLGDATSRPDESNSDTGGCRPAASRLPLRDQCESDQQDEEDRDGQCHRDRAKATV